MANASIYVSRVSSSCFLLIWEPLQDQQVGLTQAPFKLLLLLWVPEHVIFCMFPLRVEFLFHTALWDSPSKPHCPSKPNVLGVYLPGTGPTGWQA